MSYIVIMQFFLVVHHEYPMSHLYFLCKHSSLKVSVYTKKTQATNGTFHGFPSEDIE